MTVIFTRGIRIFTQSGGRRTWRATWRISNHKKAGDKFTLAHFFSPSCRACKALHSKVKEEKYAHCTFNNFTIIKRRKKCMSCINLHWYRVPFCQMSTKVHQFARMHPGLQVVMINYNEQTEICKRLNVHVLPLFRFYRGAEGQICSFSCTISTVSIR